MQLVSAERKHIVGKLAQHHYPIEFKIKFNSLLFHVRNSYFMASNFQLNIFSRTRTRTCVY